MYTVSHLYALLYISVEQSVGAEASMGTIESYKNDFWVR